MIKLTKHNGKDYVVINTEIHAGEIKAPVMIQISLVGLNEDERYKVYQHASLLLNRIIKRQSPPLKIKKPWYKFW